MKLQAFLFSGIILLGVLTITPVVQANTTTPVNPSTIPNSGYTPSIDVSSDGQRIAIAHATTANSLILTFSTNGGATWTDVAVGATGFMPQVFEFSNTNYLVVYSTVANGSPGDPESSIIARRTTNGGFSFVASTVSVTTTSTTNNCQSSYLLDSDADGNDVYVVVGSGKYSGCLADINGNNAPPVGVGIAKSTDQGATWTSNVSITGNVGVTCTQNANVCTQYGAINALNSNNATFYGGAFGFGVSGAPQRRSLIDGVWGSALTVQDSFNPFTSPQQPVWVAPDALNLTGVFVNSASAVYNVEQVGETSFRAYSTGTTSSGVRAAYYNANRSGVLKSTDSFDTLQLVESCDDGSTYSTRTIVQQGANAQVQADVATTADGVLHVAYSNGTELRYVKNDDPCGGVGAPAGSPAGLWCSAPGSANFDYDFLEDVTRVTTDPTISIDPYYKFAGDSSNYGYLGKAYGATNAENGTGSRHMKAYFRIEAGTERANANFRSVFTFIKSNGTLTTPSMDKGTGSTAGDTSGQFREHIEARFLEGSKWDMRFFYVSTSNGVTSRTQFGGSAFVDDPNTPHSYYFELNTIDGTASIRRTTDNTTLLSATIPAIFNGDYTYGHFHVGFHTSTFTGDEHRMALDEDAHTNLSTCIEDLDASTGFLGSAGLDTDTLNLEDENPPPGSENPAAQSLVGILPGVDEATAAILLAIIYILIFSAGAYGIFGHSIPGMVIGALMGFVFSIFQGLLPDVLVFIIVLLAAVAVGFRLFGGGSGNSSEGM